jgi:membrane protein YqaA with SNARE-associated domain
MANSTQGAPNNDVVRASWTRTALRILALLAVVGLTLAIVLFRKQLAGLAVYGYPGLFLVSLIGNATIILPAPSLALVFASGSSLYPPLIGLAAGSGEALGELTGYLAGYSGSGIIENQQRYTQIERWMRRGGLWVIFGLSLIPNPFFDLAGMAAGAMQVPVWRFLAACWAGKVLKTMWVAYAGAGSIAFIERMLAH